LPANGSRLRRAEVHSSGYDRGRGAGEAAAILIDCWDVVIVSTDSCASTDNSSRLR
jgi:hypothetical protein